MSEQLPLARITKAVVLKDDGSVILYAEGRAPGAGASLVLSRSPDRMLPPGFVIHAMPGNAGIIPDPDFEMEVVAAMRFHADANSDEYRVIHAGGVDTVSVISVAETTSM